jgi:hypothetical protein
MGVEDIEEKIKILEAQKSRLQSELWKVKRKPGSEVAYILLALGLIFSALAVMHSHNVSAYIGIALTFWGALLLYVKPTNYIRKEILEKSIEGFMTDMEHILEKLNFSGIPKYVSQGTLAGFKKVKIVLTKTDLSQLPSDEQLSDDRMFLDEPPTMILTPPGFELSKLIEQELNVDLLSITISDLLKYLEKALVEGLEIAKSFKAEFHDNIVQAIIQETTFDAIIKQINKNGILKYIGDPLISAVACTLVLNTRQMIVINTIDFDDLNNSTKVIYEIIK